MFEPSGIFPKKPDHNCCDQTGEQCDRRLIVKTEGLIRIVPYSVLFLLTILLVIILTKKYISTPPFEQSVSRLLLAKGLSYVHGLVRTRPAVSNTRTGSDHNNCDQNFGFSWSNTVW